MLCREYQYVVFLVVLGFALGADSEDNKQGWGGIDLHCRNNENNPVDWWFLYKPGAVTDSPLDLAFNFTYISSDEYQNRWQLSSIPINGQNMLIHTTAPLFRPTYHEHLGAVIYSDRVGKGRVSGTSASGVILADEVGGVWLTHSLLDYPTFAYDELKEGHLIACFSLPRLLPNTLGPLLNRVVANITYVRMPKEVRPYLPDWDFIVDPPAYHITSPKLFIEQFKFTGIKNNVTMLFRSPGEKRCLYRTFAQRQGIVLDVYGQSKNKKSKFCTKDYSVRNIASISINLEDQKVEYLHDRPDRMRFAVSTAAPWQMRGASKTPQYWTCLSNVDKEDMTGKGGYLLCIENYEIWQSFSNLKVEEPSCWEQRTNNSRRVHVL